MNNSNIFSSTGVNSPAPSARKHASVDINNKKRSSYSFTLARVGLEEELDNFLLEKTAKGTGLTVSNYIRDLINRDYRGQLNNANSNTCFNGSTAEISPAIKDVVISTKSNTDAILRLLSSLNLDTVDMHSLASSNIQGIANTYDFDKILNIISDKLTELHEIRSMLSNIGVAKGDSSVAKLESISKLIDNQGKKIDRLEAKLDDNFETIIDLLKGTSVASVVSSITADDEVEDVISEADRIAALLNNDIEDDDE